jgi:hypothetical protein
MIRFDRALMMVVLITVLLMAVLGGDNALSADTVAPLPTLELPKGVHFLGPEGEDVLVGPGTFEVDAVENGLRLKPKEGKPEDTKIIQAEAPDTVAIEQGETPVEPQTLFQEMGEDRVFVAFLKADGTVVEAIGLYRGVQGRGLDPYVRDRRGGSSIVYRETVTDPPGGGTYITPKRYQVLSLSGIWNLAVDPGKHRLFPQDRSYATQSVTFSLNGIKICSDEVPNYEGIYECSYQTPSKRIEYPDGLYRDRKKGYDFLSGTIRDMGGRMYKIKGLVVCRESCNDRGYQGISIDFRFLNRGEYTTPLGDGTIWYPNKDGQQVSGMVHITVDPGKHKNYDKAFEPGTGFNPYAIRFVEIIIDGIEGEEPCPTEKKAPYTCDWDTTLFVNGKHKLYGMVFDWAHQRYSIKPREVIVQNQTSSPPSSTPPRPVIIDPNNPNVRDHRTNPAPPLPPSNVTTVIVDNRDASVTRTGKWCPSNAQGFHGTDSEFAGSSCDTTEIHTFRWTPNLPKMGKYDVYIWYPNHPNRSTAVPVIVSHPFGKTEKTFNQQTGGGQWVLHGQYTFRSGLGGFVEVSDRNGQAGADAVKFVLAP